MARCREWLDSCCRDCGKCASKGIRVPDHDDREQEAMKLTLKQHDKPLKCSQCGNKQSVYALSVRTSIPHGEVLLCGECAYEIGIQLLGQSRERLHNGG